MYENYFFSCTMLNQMNCYLNQLTSRIVPTKTLPHAYHRAVFLTKNVYKNSWSIKSLVMVSVYLLVLVSQGTFYFKRYFLRQPRTILHCYPIVLSDKLPIRQYCILTSPPNPPFVNEKPFDCASSTTMQYESTLVEHVLFKENISMHSTNPQSDSFIRRR